MSWFLAAAAVVALSAPAVAASQTVPTPDPASAPVGRPAQAGAEGRLSDLVAELEGSSPELKAAQREIDMRLARIGPAGAPPDPTLSVGYMGGLARPFFPSGTSGGFQQVAASQEIPFPGKLSLRSRVAAADVDVSRWSYETTRLNLVAELKREYVEYALTDRSLAIVRRNKELLEQFARITEAQFSVGKAPQQDVLKAQLEVSLLIERIEKLENARIARQAAVNALLYRAPEVPLDPALAIDVMGQLPPLQELQRRAGERYPALRRDEQAIARGQQALALARRDVLPDFAVNIVTQRPAADMPWMYGVDVMVRIPIYWQRKQRPMIAEAAASLDASRRMRESTLASASARVTRAHADVTTSQRLLALYGDSVLPQARLALESSIAAYQVGAADFLTLLTNFTTVLEYEVGYEEQRTQLYAALASLEPLVGQEFLK